MLVIVLLLLYQSCIALELGQRGKQKEKERQRDGKKKGGGGREGRRKGENEG